jgi:hypothetical protein
MFKMLFVVMVAGEEFLQGHRRRIRSARDDFDGRMMVG